MEKMTFSLFAAELLALLGMIAPVWLDNHKIRKGQLCQLRSEMLRIYYHNRGSEEIRQYEYENFVLLYEAYKTLRGNSFIDKIYKEVQEWDVVT
ncbi:MAG: hypothetical protein IJB57_07490 [Clostridia bacterium]|nr:hypothetical protein [Clostridia bacterium]